jgi:hypothetical protein
MNLASHQYKILVKRSLLATAVSIFTLLLFYLAWQHLIRPPRTAQTQQLFKGIVYQREARSLPRPNLIHIITIDLTAPGIKLLVTPGLSSPRMQQLPGLSAPIPVELPARTTSEFLNEFKLQVAVNANFHYPSRDNGLGDFYPHTGDMVNLVGQAISNSLEYSASEPNWSVLCISTTKQAKIMASGKCPSGTDQAVAGSAMLVDRGQAVSVDKNAPDNNGLLPRTVVAIDEAGNKLWLVIVDGRQPFYSEGVTLAELSQILVELGVYSAVNLDGGGSVSLVVAQPQGAKLLNSAVRNRIPMRQRPVGNHLGIYAQPTD